MLASGALCSSLRIYVAYSRRLGMSGNTHRHFDCELYVAYSRRLGMSGNTQTPWWCARVARGLESSTSTGSPGLSWSGPKPEALEFFREKEYNERMAWTRSDFGAFHIIGKLPCAGRIIRVRPSSLHEDKAYLSSPDDFFSDLNLYEELVWQCSTILTSTSALMVK